MTTQEVADKYYQYAQTDKWANILDELYSQDILSVEPESAASEPVKGLDAIKEKSRIWSENISQVHSGYCNKPIVAGSHFSLTMGMDISLKDNSRNKFDEVCVFEVKDGKIVKEQFFY